jgi:hypothetical protein
VWKYLGSAGYVISYCLSAWSSTSTMCTECRKTPLGEKNC